MLNVPGAHFFRVFDEPAAPAAHLYLDVPRFSGSTLLHTAWAQQLSWMGWRVREEDPPRLTPAAFTYAVLPLAQLVEWGCPCAVPSDVIRAASLQKT